MRSNRVITPRGVLSGRVLLPTLIVALLASGGLLTNRCAAQVPPPEVQSMLIKNAITAVSHGNLTGNYTVLRDLGTPAFRERNTAAQLATIFQRLREQKLDLSPVLVLEPQMTETPTVNGAGQLYLIGYFPTQPQQVQFRLAFQAVGDGWVLDTVSIGSTVAPKAGAHAANNPSPLLPIDLRSQVGHLENSTRPNGAYRQ